MLRDRFLGGGWGYVDHHFQFFFLKREFFQDYFFQGRFIFGEWKEGCYRQIHPFTFILRFYFSYFVNCTNCTVILRIRDTTIVIDGNNIFPDLVSSCRDVHVAYGGEYRKVFWKKLYSIQHYKIAVLCVTQISASILDRGMTFLCKDFSGKWASTL